LISALTAAAVLTSTVALANTDLAKKNNCLVQRIQIR
jgi:hypothetical protein